MKVPSWEFESPLLRQKEMTISYRRLSFLFCTFLSSLLVFIFSLKCHFQIKDEREAVALLRKALINLIYGTICEGVIPMNSPLLDKSLDFLRKISNSEK